MDGNFLDLKNVQKTFSMGKDIEIAALQNINLKFSDGEFTVFSGPSGSGKTTLLNMIGCLDQVTSGTIYLENFCLTALPEKRLSSIRRDHIGFVFQAFNLIPVLNAKENIEYVMKLQGKSKDICSERSFEIATKLNIDHLLEKLPSQMSGGQQQRVAVARAIAAKPKLILADEPTANLDSKSGQNLIELMYELNQSENITVIFASHDPNVIMKAQRNIIIQDGKIIEDRNSSS